MFNEQLDTIATIASIFKSGKNFYVKLHYNHNTQTTEKITLEEASQLEVGQEIKYVYWWNENGRGQGGKIPRPIQIYEEQKPKYRTLK